MPWRRIAVHTVVVIIVWIISITTGVERHGWYVLHVVVIFSINRLIK